MAELRVPAKDIRASADAKRANLSSLRFTLPLVASLGTFILIGCASSSIKQNGTEVGRMGNTGNYAFAQQQNPQEAAPKDTTLKTIKTTPKPLSRENRLNERIQQLKGENREDYSSVSQGDREHQISVTPERKAELVTKMMYRIKELDIYYAALKPDSVAVEKAITDLMDFADSRGETAKGEDIVRNFRARNSP